MIKANFNAYNRYVTDSVYQWDIDQVLTVNGLNLVVAPEVHFSNANTDRAIPRQTVKTDKGFTVKVPNSLLQEPFTIYAHVGIYEGDTFKVIELVEVPVKPRKRPLDYKIEDSDEEVYSFKKLENNIANMVTKADAKVINARIDSLIAHKNDTEGNSELIDMRISADGTKYATAGESVRKQFENVNRLKTNVPFELELGSITNGVDEPNATRARLKDRIKACSAVVSFSGNIDYYFGYAVYNDIGEYDGIDHGWNAITSDARVEIPDGYFKFNFRRADNATITDADLNTLRDTLKITQFNVLSNLDELNNLVNVGYPVINSYSLELGSLADGNPVDFDTRARFTEKLRVTDKTVITVSPNGTYHYGYAAYDESGVFDGVDHGWNLATNRHVIELNHNGYIRMNFKRLDDMNITEEDLATIYDLVTITTAKNAQDIEDKINEDYTKVMTDTEHNNAISSILVDYGRVEGASYVFARIPKVTNDGKKLKPIVKLTSTDSTISGDKTSALLYSQREKTIFTLNAGLFNTTTMQPVGQTIIDGEVLVSTPMVDDMGSPISDNECYPLCIDNNGDLSAPYNRNVDTAAMLIDGVVHAVTGWGKIIDNFVACSDTVENEIVHAGNYIRQCIGQFQNGDYFVCTVDMSRGTIENESGVTYSALADLLISKGVKFAYSLDGGGSAETIIGQRQLNPIYEGEYGRSVPTVITFELT